MCGDWRTRPCSDVAPDYEYRTRLLHVFSRARELGRVYTEKVAVAGSPEEYPEVGGWRSSKKDFVLLSIPKIVRMTYGLWYDSSKV